jgi:hypothetical protein
MDETDTTFDERVDEVRQRRREAPQRPLGNDLTGEPVGVPDLGAAGTTYSPEISTTGKSDDEVEALRRDISRLEGKIDALLAALTVEVGDGGE